jgi:hypothetical protein
VSPTIAKNQKFENFDESQLEKVESRTHIGFMMHTDVKYCTYAVLTSAREFCAVTNSVLLSLSKVLLNVLSSSGVRIRWGMFILPLSLLKIEMMSL